MHSFVSLFSPSTVMCSRDAPDTDIAGYPAYREAGYRISGIAGYGIPGYYFYLKQKKLIYDFHKPLFSLQLITFAHLHFPVEESFWPLFIKTYVAALGPKSSLFDKRISGLFGISSIRMDTEFKKGRIIRPSG